MPKLIRDVLRSEMQCGVFAIAMSAAATQVGAAGDPVAESKSALLRQARLAEAASKPKAIARATFLCQPTILGVQLSPDGRFVSFLRRNDAKRLDVWLREVATGRQHRVVDDVGNVELAWSGDSRYLWLSDAQGLALIDAATRTARRVYQWDGRRAQRLWHVDRRAPAHAVIYERSTADAAKAHRYLTVDTGGKVAELFASQRPLRSVTLKADGGLAFVAAYDGDRYDTVIRRYDDAGVRELMRCTGIERCDVVASDAQQTSLWVFSQHGESHTALQRWQARSGRWETVHRDPAAIADADSALFTADGAEWQAVAYYRDHRHWSGRDATTNAHLGAVHSKLAGANLALSRSLDGRVWLVRAHQSNWAVDRHYLYQPLRDELEPIFASDDVPPSELSPETLVTASPISWRASDGMLLHGYVYLPKGVALKEAPLIAWLHGGPVARNVDEFEPRLQMLASRGYAVFAPDFRASSGYGLNYTLSAKGDVGNGRVLADVIDGLDFLLAQGIGDRTKQAVAGHSFGGYASLLAASHHPGRFRFAFAGAPPTDYGWMKQWQAEHDSESIRGDGPPLSVQFVQHRMNPEDSAWRDRMRRESPLQSLSKLKSKIYIWAGAQDDHVPLKSVANYATEAVRLGKSMLLLIDPDSLHAPRQALNSEAWMYLLERAADQQFGGGTTPPSSELLDFVRRNRRIDTDRLLGDEIRRE